MPTKREREYYSQGFQDGLESVQREADRYRPSRERIFSQRERVGRGGTPGSYTKAPKPKRKLSAWNKFIKANAKKPRFRLRSGSPNLKKMAVAFRKTPAGKKKRR